VLSYTILSMPSYSTFKKFKIEVEYCKRVAKRYNQMNGGSANGNAFVDWHLTTGLSLQVAGTVQCHVTPPHSSLPIHVLVP
jgi:hypothetical protein